MGLKIKRGDTVVVISGKEKGKRGEVEHVLPRENRVVVNGVNVRRDTHGLASRTSRGSTTSRPP